MPVVRILTDHLSPNIGTPLRVDDVVELSDLMASRLILDGVAESYSEPDVAAAKDAAPKAKPRKGK